MDPNVEENIDPNNSVIQRIIINNFEIKLNNFMLKGSSKTGSNDITMMAIMENYTADDDKFMTKSSGDFAKIIEEENNDEIIKESKCFISCKFCNCILALEGSTYSKLK